MPLIARKVCLHVRFLATLLFGTVLFIIPLHNPFSRLILLFCRPELHGRSPEEAFQRLEAQHSGCHVPQLDRSDLRPIPWVEDSIRTVRIFALPTLVVHYAVSFLPLWELLGPFHAFPPKSGTLIADKIHHMAMWTAPYRQHHLSSFSRPRIDKRETITHFSAHLTPALKCFHYVRRTFYFCVTRQNFTKIRCYPRL